MKRKIFTLLAFAMLLNFTAKAQESFKDKLQIGGFIQTDFEWLQYQGKSNTGSNQFYNPDRDGEDKDYFIRYGVRRGGIRLAYSEGITQGVFELDLNDGGIVPKAAMINIKPADWIEINAGLQTIWFGEETPYSTPKQEVLEHCDLLRNIFFLDRDLGLKLSLIAPKDSRFNGLRFDFGFVSGNNINRVPDGKMNFVGRLKYSTQVNNVYAAVGTSVYYGKVNNASNVWFNYINDSLWSYNKKANTKNTRFYYGVDAQIKFPTSMGSSEIKTEWVLGTQPSQVNSFRSPDNNEYDPTNPFNIEREFFGGYIYYFQDLWQSPFRLLLKYTLMNPNTEADKKFYLSSTDITYQTFGIGCQWNITKGLRFTTMFNVNLNEKSDKMPSYSYDRKDNHLIMRLQYEF
ncbi:MAG: hypothetical protein IJ759_01530 [Bacteroidales bacterium]|nr:hypothetical protein [Bacteroidales bacterium]